MAFIVLEDECRRVLPGVHWTLSKLGGPKTKFLKNCEAQVGQFHLNAFQQSLGSQVVCNIENKRRYSYDQRDLLLEQVKLADVPRFLRAERAALERALVGCPIPEAP